MSGPLVSVVTPVYNGAKFLAQCIESVIAQDYANWEYHIVDNCSSDDTIDIAAMYARQDSRIQVVRNATFLNVASSHNRAFRSISPGSAYCKVVSADDWLLPNCVGRMVRFGQARPSVGIVGSYQRSAEAIRWQAVPVGVDVLSGREACRLALLTGAQIFGAPTAFMYRSDLVRKAEAFFPDCQPHADTSACYSALQECDFGFIHEILSVERVHPDQVSSSIERLGGGCVAYLDVFLKYGRNYLTEEEYIQRMTEVLDTYYRYLGGCALKLRGADFWRFHRSRLDDIGCGLDWSRVARGMVKEVFAEMSTPLEAARKVAQAIRDRRQGR